MIFPAATEWQMSQEESCAKCWYYLYVFLLHGILATEVLTALAVLRLSNNCFPLTYCTDFLVFLNKLFVPNKLVERLTINQENVENTNCAM